MAKRRNEGNQESKEDYEAREHREEMEARKGGGGDTVETGYGFSRASDQALKSRRIISVSTKWKKKATGSIPPPAGAGAIPTATAASTASTLLTSKNPFANTVLTTSTESKPKSNPFASISFASSSTASGASTTSTTPASFQAGSAKRVKPSSTTTTTTVDYSTSSFNKSTNLQSSSLSSSSSPIPPLRDGAKQNDSILISEGTKLTLAMLRMAQLEYQANPLSDWTPWLQTYLEKAGELSSNLETVNEEKKDNEIQNSETKGSTGSMFSFGNSLTSNATSSGGSGVGGDKLAFGFSSGSSATATATTTQESTKSKEREFTGFSFTPAPSTSSTETTPAPTTSPPMATEKKTEEGYVEIGKPDQVLKAINEDEEELYECRAKYRKKVDKEWKSFSAGLMRLTKSKSSGASQLVIRDFNVGKVQFNIGVSKGMDFKEPQITKGKANILFYAVQDQKKGPELFALVVKAEEAGKLHGQLKAITGQ